MNNSARQAFKESGLTYNDVFDHLSVMKGEIGKKLADHAKAGGMAMKLSGLKTRVRFLPGTRNVECFFLFVDGPYFMGREAVSFNPDGFIGFAGWASAGNIDPIIKGFLSAISKIQGEMA